MVVGRLRGRCSTPHTAHPFDLEHGLETSGVVHGGRLALGHRNAPFSTAYIGVPPSRMRAVLDRWRATPGGERTEECAFVDMGCGKGRALLLGAELPFREGMGVEFDAELAGVARRNVECWSAAGRPRCLLRVVHGDVTEVALPEGALLVYLFNPFQAPVLRQVLDRLQRRRSAVDVLYLYPKEESVFAEFPAFELLWREGISLAAEDVGADGTPGEADPCSAYRLRR
jgi:SAM-dependent methyltransferase